MLSAPIRATTTITFDDTGRLFRLAHQVAVPPRVYFAAPVPVEGKRMAHASFQLPAANEHSGPVLISGPCEVHYDPDYPQRGGYVAFLTLSPVQQNALVTYIQRASHA